jgi:hypothetical protein
MGYNLGVMERDLPKMTGKFKIMIVHKEDSNGQPN